MFSVLGHSELSFSSSTQAEGKKSMNNNNADKIYEYFLCLASEQLKEKVKKE